MGTTSFERRCPSPQPPISMTVAASVAARADIVVPDRVDGFVMTKKTLRRLRSGHARGRPLD